MVGIVYGFSLAVDPRLHHGKGAFAIALCLHQLRQGKAAAYPQTNYMSELQARHQGRRERVNRKQRRDALVSRTDVAASAAPVAASAVVASVAPPTEAAFCRKREAAITKAVAGSASKRARVAPAMNWVQEAGDPEVAPACACVEDIAKCVVQQASKSAASVAAKREVQVVRSSVQVSVAAEAQPRDAGILLARQRDGAAIQKAHRLGYKLIHNPVEFVSVVGKRPRSSL